MMKALVVTATLYLLPKTWNYFFSFFTSRTWSMVVLLKVAASSLLYELSVNTGTVSQGGDRIYSY